MMMAAIAIIVHWEIDRVTRGHGLGCGGRGWIDRRYDSGRGRCHHWGRGVLSRREIGLFIQWGRFTKEARMALLHMIGSGTPTPTAERFGTCFVRDLDGELLMFDCGRRRRTTSKCRNLADADYHLFFTHHHFDHNADYACFLLCRWDQKHWARKKPLKVVEAAADEGGDGAADWGGAGAYVFDLQARMNHPASQRIHQNRGGTLPRPGPRVEVTGRARGRWRAAGSRWKVTAGMVRHVEPWLNSLAYRVESEGRDSAWGFYQRHRALRDAHAAGGGCQVVVTSGCWGVQEEMQKTGEDLCIWRHAGCGEHRQRVGGAWMLVLTHTGSRLCTEAVKKQGPGGYCGGIFPGKVVFGEELMKIPL